LIEIGIQQWCFMLMLEVCGDNVAKKSEVRILQIRVVSRLNAYLVELTANREGLCD